MNVREYPRQNGTEQDANAGTISHSKRVAAWCEELGRALHLPLQELGALCNAGLAHHRPELLGNSAMDRIMGDLGVSIVGRETQLPLATRLMEEILAAYQDTEAARSPRVLELARLLEVANCLDEQLEYAPFDEESAPPAPAPNEDGHAEEMFSFALRHLRVCSKDDLLEALPKLPVYPAAAMRLHRMLQGEVNLRTLEDIACTDPVIAGKLVKAANSAYYSPAQPIRTVTQAISHIGTNDARRILLTSSIQPLYGSPRMRLLWKHSLEAAQVAERFAEISGKVNPAEAFLIGLLHDVGKLAIALLSREVNDSIQRLLSKGCQLAAAETVFCGFDHAEAGAEVLKHWKFEEELIEAVRHHHQPERSNSTLSSVLYLTEFWTDSEEDLPSNTRLTAALERTTLSSGSWHVEGTLTDVLSDGAI
jgi:putative nucleotidyltransferase with HDIG domain